MEWQDMLVEGGLVSKEWLTTAWDQTVRDRDPNTLIANLYAHGPVKGRDAMPDVDRNEHRLVQEIANRMRQKARKKGLIEMAGKPRRWRFVDSAS